jgi:hypothetical protein
MAFCSKKGGTLRPRSGGTLYQGELTMNIDEQFIEALKIVFGEDIYQDRLQYFESRGFDVAKMTKGKIINYLVKELNWRYKNDTREKQNTTLAESR